MTTTSDQQINFPANSDVNDGPTAFANALGANPTTGASGTGGVESRLVKRYLSTSDRSLRNTAPATNEVSARADAPGKLSIFNGSTWQEFGLPYIARQTLGGSAASVTFSGIPTNLRALVVRWTARSDAVVQTQSILLRINGDTGNNYNAQAVSGVNTAASGTNLPAANAGFIGSVCGASAPANAFACGVTDFIGWDSPHAQYLGWVFTSQGLGNGAANFVVQAGGGQYTPAGPYTSITLFPVSGNFVAGSDFQLHGDLS